MSLVSEISDLATRIGTEMKGRIPGFRNGVATPTKIDVLTEAQFAAIGTKDSNTIYMTY